MQLSLTGTWQSKLASEFEKDYMLKLYAFIEERKTDNAVIYPPQDLLFNALNTTAFEDVRVVILGQDPYHGPNQAHGLSFSVQDGVAIPPSLRNMYKELLGDPQVDFKQPETGNLMPWAKQGVLLLNAVLSVEQASAGAHAKKGWEKFTDAVISHLSEESENIVFILWGAYAQKKGAVIDRNKHLVLESPHPSPLSAHRGFLGCGHFSKTNDYLKSHNLKPINWQI